MPNTFVIDYRKLAREIIDLAATLGVAANELLYMDVAGTTVVGSPTMNSNGHSLYLGNAYLTGNGIFFTANFGYPVYYADVEGADAGYAVNKATGAGVSQIDLLMSAARGTLALPTVVVNGDILGNIAAGGYDGAAMQQCASIDAVVDGVPAAGNVPLGWEFWTGHSAATQVKRLGLSSAGSLLTENTKSAAIGAVQIDKMSGQCNVAGGVQTVVVTNALVTATSMVFATIAQDDATAIIKNVVAGAGSFTIKFTAVCTGNTKVNFLVVN